MTWQITDHLDLTAGLRYDHNDQEFSVFVSGAPVDSGQDSDGVTTWTAAARYRVTPDVMLYGRVATGSQPGISTGSVFSGAEMVTSYEAGLKSEFLDHRCCSMFRCTTSTGPTSVVAFEKPVNVGTAKSQGGELISSYSPLPGLKLGFIAAFTQCEFTEMTPPADFILTGYQLAQVPKWSMASSADYDWAISNAWHAHVGGSLRWIGRQWGLWVQSQSLGGYPTLEKLVVLGIGHECGHRKRPARDQGVCPKSPGHARSAAQQLDATPRRTYAGGGLYPATPNNRDRLRILVIAECACPRRGATND